MKNSYKIGVKGEAEALKYLQMQNLCLVKKRYKTSYGEIDLIMKSSLEIIFLEVKNSSIKEGLISPRQLQRIISASEVFLAENPIYGSFIRRYDAIFINTNINHIQNISF